MNITETKIKYIIGNPGLEESLMEEQKKLLEKIKNQNENLDSIHDELIGSAALKGRELRHDVLSRTNSKNDGIYGAIEQAERIQQEYFTGLQEQFFVLVEQLEMVQRARLCFDTLDVESRLILNRLYRDKEKWEYVEKNMGINHRTFITKRNFAMYTVMERYNSRLTMRELGKMKNKDKEDNVTQRKQGKEIAGQISLF